MFYFSLAVFFMFVMLYAGLYFLNRAQNQAKTEMEIQIEVKGQEIKPELLDQIFSLESKTKNIQKIIGGHIHSLNILQFLEKKTLPKVRFVNFNLGVGNRVLQMDGEATNYESLTNQILIFQQDPQVEGVRFEGLTLGNNNLVNFRITINFKDSILKINPQ